MRTVPATPDRETSFSECGRKSPDRDALKRRLEFSSACHHGIETGLAKFGIPPTLATLHTQHAACLSYDLIEGVRGMRVPQWPGRAHRAALANPERVPQEDRHLGYWYDQDRHALVGCHLGLDLYRQGGTHHVVECNFTAALRPERRALYADRYDPWIKRLAEQLKVRGFERLVLYRQVWRNCAVSEFAPLSRDLEIEIRALSRDPAEGKPTFALPRPLQENTAYILCSGWTRSTALQAYVTDKFWAAQWLSETLAGDDAATSVIAQIPTYERLTVPPPSEDPRWPNLVAKITDKSNGTHVAMGRFRDAAEARRHFKLPAGDDGAIPGIFDLRARDRFRHRITPGSRIIYQPFVPPEVVDNRARMTRLHVFLSPLHNAYLSAHHVVSHHQLPTWLDWGLVDNEAGAFLCNFGGGADYTLVDPATEEELRGVAHEYGRLARWAFARKFEIGP